MRDLLDQLLRIEDWAQELAVTFTESFWLYPALFFFTMLDAFIPMAPAESLIIATTTAWSNGDYGVFEFTNPFLWGIIVAAVVGAWCGDQIAYTIGSKINVRKIRMFRTARGVSALAWAEHSLEKRGVTFIIAARHIPFGRITVNLMAGALGYPRRRFMGVDLVAVIIWVLFSVALGTFAGAIIDNLIISVLVGIAAGIVFGIIADKVLSKLGIAPVELPDIAAELTSEIPLSELGKRAQAAARREIEHGHREHVDDTTFDRVDDD